MLIRSKLLEALGFAHGFSTREGGVSAPPFDSLNLARTVGDDPVAVEENHVRLARAVGYDVRRLAESSQVHGVRCVDADAFLDAEGTLEVAKLREERADALVASVHGLAIGVRTADCVPLLVGDPQTRAVAAIHAGWRGAVDGVVLAGLDALAAKTGGGRERFVVAIGPHIRLASFEVGDEVVDAMEAAMPHGALADALRDELFSRRAGARSHACLAALVTAQLLSVGIERSRIDDVGGDTLADRSRFHSHRRDGARSGRQLSVIVVG